MYRPHTAYVTRAVGLSVAAVVLNIAFGHLVRNILQWPVYLDSIGTIVVGALLGPAAGAIVGAASNVIWAAALGDLAVLPYAIVAAFIGWAAGVAAGRGAFRRFAFAPLAGVLVGGGAALLSAPITAYVFGGVTGSGTDFLNAFLAQAGANVLQAATIQGLVSDPLDKALSFAVAWPIWRLLRPRLRPAASASAWPIEALGGHSTAVLVNLLVSLTCFVFLPAFGRGIFALFYLASLVAAWRGGWGPAVLTMTVGTVANLLFLVSPYHNIGITAEDWLRVGVFVVVSLSIAAIANQLERSKRDLRASLVAERASRARMRAITDSVNEALMLVAADGRVLDANRHFERMFGTPPERVAGQRVADLRTLFDQVFADPAAVFARLAEEGVGSPPDRALAVRQSWPAPRDLDVYATPVRDNGADIGRLFVFRDVTREREIDRMKTEFVSLVSHELRTPLTSIKGYTEMVLDGDAGDIGEEVREYLDVAHSNAERLVALVNDLLDLSRIESGRIALKSETVDLDEVARAVVATMQPKLEEKGQSLSVAVDPTAARVIGDRDKLIQVLTNYVSNAHKYTQAGGAIRVGVRLDAGAARVEVGDNGHGIAPEDQAKLFTRFYRVDNSMTREVGGTGLGLSIVKELIELQGGAVGVESALGRGSTFWFSVPLAAPAAEVAGPGPTPATPAPTGAHILVVEDDADVAKLIQRHLEKAGHLARIALSAEEAILAIEDDLPDLITLDIDLPGMKGDELARRLRADPVTRDVPLLILSIYAGEATAAQFDAIALAKPINQGELLSTVARLLREAQRTTVLVVDIDVEERAALAQALGSHGIDVAVADGGPSGLKQAAETRPGLVLLNIDAEDGLRTLRALREARATADIPVIAMTGAADAKTAARARVLAMGASDLIARPVDLSMLATEVNLFLKGGGV